MIRSLLSFRKTRIIVDVDTQKDIFLQDGSYCVRNHRRVLMNIRRMMAWARVNNIRVISTARISPENNISSKQVEHCIENSFGQQKLSYTMMKNHILFPSNGSTDIQEDVLYKYQQIIINKRCEDPFEEPRADRIFTEVSADEFLLIGANTEDSVKETALGLLQRGKNVILLTDAIGSHEKKAAQMAIRQMQAKGAKVTETKAYAGTSKLKNVGACDCPRCQPGKTLSKISSFAS